MAEKPPSFLSDLFDPPREEAGEVLMSDKDWEEIFDNEFIMKNSQLFRQDENDIVETLEDMFKDCVIEAKKELAEDQEDSEWVDVGARRCLQDSAASLCEGAKSGKESEGKAQAKFLEGAKDIIYTPRNVTTAKKYSSYQQLYKTYCKEMDCEHLASEQTTFCNFYYDSIQSKKFGVGSVWAVYAALNNYSKKEFGKNLNQFAMLRSMMRNITHKYLPK